MKTILIPASLMSMTVLCATSCSKSPVKSIVLENDAIRAEIVPAWAGRLMFFGRKGGTNVMWTQPEAADFGRYPSGTPMWKNVGGEKTWVGSQDVGWRAFAGVEEGGVWPPPAWFDSMPMKVVKADATNVVLRTDAYRGGDWVVAMEREFTLEADALVIRQRLMPEEVGACGPDVQTNDMRRLWSVAQVTRPKFVMIRLCGECRHVTTAPIPDPVPAGVPGWAHIDLPPAEKAGKFNADGDALAVQFEDGWFLIEQTAPARHLGAFTDPGRAMLYISTDDFKPAPYAELEFAAYGPDAEQTLRLSLPRDSSFLDFK